MLLHNSKNGLPMYMRYVEQICEGQATKFLDDAIPAREGT